MGDIPPCLLLSEQIYFRFPSFFRVLRFLIFGYWVVGWTTGDDAGMNDQY